MDEWDRYEKSIERELEAKPPTRKRTLRLVKEEPPEKRNLDDQFTYCQKGDPNDALRVAQLIGSVDFQYNDTEVSEYLFVVQKACCLIIVKREQGIVKDKQFTAVKAELSKAYDKLYKLWTSSPHCVEWESKINTRRSLATIAYIIQREFKTIEIALAPPEVEMKPSSPNLKDCNMREIIALCQHVIHKWFMFDANSIVWKYVESLCFRMNDFVGIYPKKAPVFDHVSYMEIVQGHKQANQDFYIFLHTFDFEVTTVARKHKLVMENLNVHVAPPLTDEQVSSYHRWVEAFANDELSDSVRKITEDFYFRYHLPPATLLLYVSRLMETKQLDDHPVIYKDNDFCTGAYATIHPPNLKLIQDRIFFKKPIDVVFNEKLMENAVLKPVVNFMHMCFFHMVFKTFTEKRFLDDHVRRDPTFKDLSTDDKKVMIGMFCGEYYISCQRFRTTFCTRDIATALYTFLDMYCRLFDPPIQSFVELKNDMFKTGRFHRRTSVDQESIFKNLDDDILQYTTK